MTIKQKIANGLSCAGLVGVLTGCAMDIYKMEQVKDTVAERLERNEEPVYDEQINQFPKLKELYDDRTGIHYFTFPGLLLLGIGGSGSSFRGVPGGASSYKNKGAKEK